MEYKGYFARVAFDDEAKVLTSNKPNCICIAKMDLP